MQMAGDLTGDAVGIGRAADRAVPLARNSSGRSRSPARARRRRGGRRGELEITSQFIVGLTPFTAFAASAVAQLALGRLTLPKQLATGTFLFPVGLALTALSLYQPALWLWLVPAGLSGAAAGLLFKGSVTQSAIAAAPASRAGVLAVFFIIAYLGMGLPSVTFSLLIQHIPLRATMIAFAALLSVGPIAAVITAIRTNRKARWA
ncbi:MAG: hypothetical protein QOI36_5890 [Pseudonocardiales bacterium]|nr:hypothetical protein [Pseudonocardiales bacterium]